VPTQQVDGYAARNEADGQLVVRVQGHHWVAWTLMAE